MNYKESIIFSKADADLFKYNKCDKYDYMIAVGSGAIAGIVDVFLVGTPGDSILEKWTDTQVDNAVKGFANLCGWKPRAGNENNVNSAIGFLEKKFPVNYDHRNSSDVNNAFKMGTTNHHMKSLAHSPDIIGLFFSILNQFTSTATFLSSGQMITVKTDTHELQGNNFISKLFCGCVNWVGHLMSDVAGSSGGKGRGSGIVMPFYELFSLCNFGKFQIGNDRQDLATLATRAFQEGYDFRFGMAMAIPVLLSELLIRLIWAIKRYFYHKMPLKECIPLQKHESLRSMLIIGNGVLCVIDVIDAGIRSGGNMLKFFLRLNMMAWCRLVMLVLKEVFIRLGIAADMQAYLDSYKQVNEQLKAYFTELEKIDKDKFIEETAMYSSFELALSNASDERQLNVLLRDIFEKIDALPWGDGSFDDFMQDKNKTLVFE